MNKKRLNGKYIKLIVSLASVSLFLFAYFKVYIDYEKRTEEIVTQTKIVREQIAKRKQDLAEEEVIRQETELLRQKCEDIINSYPSYLAKEDNFMFVEKLAQAMKVSIPSINPSDSTLFYTTKIPARKVEENTVKTDSNLSSDTMTALQSTISMNFRTTYQGFQELVDYINHYPDKTVINSASVSYDNTSGDLVGSMVLMRFALTNNGKHYEPPYIENISIGTDNIFGTDTQSRD